MTAVCKACQNTGRANSSEYYDCTACGIAQERAAFDVRIEKLFPTGAPDSDVAWCIYMMGKAAK